MRQQLANQISRKGLSVWRVYGSILSLIVLAVGIGLGFLAYYFEWPIWISIVVGVFVVLHAFFSIYLFPKVRWERWRYEVREAEIELQHGLFIVNRTLIPMVRVQHVDMAEGPILRKYGLASITISTAATNHSIPALVTEEADELRNRISMFARVAKDDV
ncbi:PH domain-containing protein [Sporosarcina sp. GW1-11]|uniref:PH domain-containing protein n=1 Tax=Sporosarcina sp. GW1-11 TaxID=2899126 RepID=UPI00294FE4C3|nr:PH domain-containing protein [Sporosarcina sp. GW1-11]MDV6378510.1 PH domain-containing protein [Sporosarcina sp. GW1-11]